MFDPLKQFDYQILHLFNVDWGDPTLDQFWLLITQLHKQMLVQFVVFPVLLLGLLYIYRGHAIKLLLALALALGIADAVSYRVVKAQVNRPRPFQNPEISSWVRKVGQAHGPSFPSNHAANAFAAAAVLAWYFSGGSYFFYIFAPLVALSRFVLGVHYPTDVLAGAGLGLFVGFLIRILLLNQVHWFLMRDSVSKPDGKSYSWRTRYRRME